MTARPCPVCGTSLAERRRDAVYCSPGCRRRAAEIHVGAGHQAQHQLHVLLRRRLLRQADVFTRPVPVGVELSASDLPVPESPDRRVVALDLSHAALTASEVVHEH